MRELLLLLAGVGCWSRSGSGQGRSTAKSRQRRGRTAEAPTACSWPGRSCSCSRWAENKGFREGNGRSMGRRRRGVGAHLRRSLPVVTWHEAKARAHAETREEEGPRSNRDLGSGCLRVRPVLTTSWSGGLVRLNGGGDRGEGDQGGSRWRFDFWRRRGGMMGQFP